MPITLFVHVLGIDHQWLWNAAIRVYKTDIYKGKECLHATNKLSFPGLNPVSSFQCFALKFVLQQFGRK